MILRLGDDRGISLREFEQFIRNRTHNTQRVELLVLRA
jgi:hypothetical protein